MRNEELLSPLIRPVGAPSPTRGEGSRQSSIAFQAKAYFIAFKLILLADVTEVGLLPLWEKVPRRARMRGDKINLIPKANHSCQK